MKGIAIFMEGGGETSSTQSHLRQGMAEFLGEIRTDCKEREWHWKLVACGGRDEAYRKFTRFNDVRYHIAVLLVDSEEHVPKDLPCHEHLMKRDGWDLKNVNVDNVHLMVQSMETWIVADLNALQEYYGPKFNSRILPTTQNLEHVSKNDVAQSLCRATTETTKGAYHKIHHAKDLLKLMESSVVRVRCPRCELLFTRLEKL